jgi:hypothetical protein
LPLQQAEYATEQDRLQPKSSKKFLISFNYSYSEGLFENCGWSRSIIFGQQIHWLKLVVKNETPAALLIMPGPRDGS